MFCSQCGVQTEGNFCHECGHRLRAPVSSVTASLAQHVPPTPETPVDWENSPRFDVVSQSPEVRRDVSNAARATNDGDFAKSLLTLYDSVEIIPVPIESLMGVAQPIGSALGIKTGKSRAITLQQPIGGVIASVIRSLARRNWVAREVEQAAEGCRIHVELPMTLWAMKGTLIADVQRQENATQLAYATNIAGQFFDWGYSSRLLNCLIEEAQSERP